MNLHLRSNLLEHKRSTKNSIIGKARFLALAGALLITAANHQVFAQSGTPAATQPAKGELDAAYVDGSFGFSVRPPAGCSLFREKQIADADVEIARFVNMAYQWSFTIRLSTTTQPLDSKTIIDGITKNLLTQTQELKVLRGEPAQIAGREGVRYSATFKADGNQWFRQQAVLASQPKEYFALIFITPLNDKSIAELLFDRIVASFQMMRDERTRDRINQALERGKKLLQHAASGDADISAHTIQDNYLRCILDGKDVGYVRVSELPTTLDHRKGVQVREWGWLFDEAGSITHLEHDMFLANDLSFERWENRLYVIPPAQKDTPRQLVVDVENAIRQDDQLGVAYMPRPNAPDKKDKVIEVEKTYASAAWNVLFPRVVDLKTPELYAFSTYKSERRGLALRTLEIIGPAKVFIDGVQTPAIKIEDSEGLIPPKSEVYVDLQGRMLRVVADRLEMEATTAQYVEQHFGAKVADGQNLLKSLQPKRQVHAPTLPDRKKNQAPREPRRNRQR